MLKQFKYRLEMNIAHLYADIVSIKRNIGWWWLKIKYGGKDKIPMDVVSNHFFGGGIEEIVSTMAITSAVQDIGKFLNQDFMEYKIILPLSRFMNGKCDRVEEFEKIQSLRAASNIRQATLDYMIELGDVSKHQLDYRFSGKQRTELDTWLAVNMSKSN